MKRAAIALAGAASLAACKSDETVTGYGGAGLWQLETTVNGAAHLSLALTPDGRLTATGPCNTLIAAQTAPYPWFRLTQIAVTERACPALKAETDTFTALRSASLVEVAQGTLILSNENGLEMVFRAAP